ncbi:hypothetical protein ACIQBJ_15670 [Kitasatospora sp. NPDC088391]|uniref:hypothetical protein n=1 Tax=Kitasatospora sp. NPDC088391 TaxID=3364074 RepID=UPI003812490B
MAAAQHRRTGTPGPGDEPAGGPGGPGGLVEVAANPRQVAELQQALRTLAASDTVAPGIRRMARDVLDGGVGSAAEAGGEHRAAG